jgi:hypothetical protein
MLGFLDEDGGGWYSALEDIRKSIRENALWEERDVTSAHIHLDWWDGYRRDHTSFLLTPLTLPMHTAAEAKTLLAPFLQTCMK